MRKGFVMLVLAFASLIWFGDVTAKSAIIVHPPEKLKVKFVYNGEIYTKKVRLTNDMALAYSLDGDSKTEFIEGGYIYRRTMTLQRTKVMIELRNQGKGYTVNLITAQQTWKGKARLRSDGTGIYYVEFNDSPANKTSF